MITRQVLFKSLEIFECVFSTGAHHLDLRASTDIDPDWLIEQRTTEVEHIAKWIAEYMRDKKLPHKVPNFSDSVNRKWNILSE